MCLTIHVRQMKHSVVILFILLLNSCTNKNDKCACGKDDKYYDFMESVKINENQNFLDRIVDIRQFGNKVVNRSELQWIRQPENLKIFYGTLKKIGLEKFIDKKEWNQKLFTKHWKKSEWQNKSLRQITSSLIESYEVKDSTNGYYDEFWNRRIIDNNKSITLLILKDILNYYEGTDLDEVFPVNDTLKNLLEYETRLAMDNYAYSEIFTQEYANALVEYELNSSAYNVIQIRKDQNAGDNSHYQELIERITIDTVDCSQYWKWRENATWKNKIIDYYH